MEVAALCESSHLNMINAMLVRKLIEESKVKEEEDQIKQIC